MKKILVIDDDPDITTLLKSRLEAQHHQVITAENAVVGLEKIFNEKPDLITLDIFMPDLAEITGLEKFGATLCDTLKHEKSLQGIPVVIISGLERDVKPEVEEMVAAADAYFTKPFDSQKLLKKIEELLNKKVMS